MKIKIENDAYLFADACVRVTEGTEVGGLFTCKQTDSGEFLVDEFFLIKQEVSHGGVDFEGEDINKLIEQLANENRLSDLRGSWHSHGKMATFYSPTDNEAIRKYYKNNPDLPWLVSLVLNLDGDILGRIDVFDSSATDQITFNDVKVDIVPSDNIMEKAKEAVDKVVSKKNWGKSKGKKKKNSDAVQLGKRGSKRGQNYDKRLWEKSLHELTDEEWKEVMEEDFING